jgi:uncharacterized protein (TIGR03435 family)
MKWRLSGVAFAFSVGFVCAQTEFDVASIKPSAWARAGGEGSGRESVVVSPNSINLGNASLSFCIQWAYNVKFYQVSGPERLTVDRYDIVAKTGKPARKEELMSMMQALLADRFHLRLHRETRAMPVYELVAPSKGARLRQSGPDQKAGMSVVNGSFVFQRVSMSAFAERISDFSAIDRPVLDKTGIEGFFDITLPSAASAMLADPQSIFSAIEGVGLRLDSRRGPVEIVVVDHVERPSGN